MNSAILILLVCLSNGIFLGLGMIAGCAICVSMGNRGGSAPEKTLKPTKKELKAQRAEEKKMKAAMDDMMHNIDVYDGTDEGQRDIKL